MQVRGGVPGRDDGRARPELPVDAAHPRRRERGHREQRGAPAEAPLDRPGRRRADRPLPRRRRARRSRVRRARDPPARRQRATIASATSRSSTAPTRRAASSRKSLVRSGIPYRVFGGVKFYDRREVKDALAYLRALVNPDDEVSWKRIVNTPRRGVGDTSVAKIDSYAQGAGVTFRDSDRATRRPPASPARRSAAARTCSSSWTRSSRRRGRRRRRRARGGARRAAATSPSSRRSARSRRRAASRTCRSWSASAREFDEQVDAGDLGGLVAIGGVGIGDRCADDAPAIRRARARAGVPRGDLARHRPRRERSRRRARSR